MLTSQELSTGKLTGRSATPYCNLELFAFDVATLAVQRSFSGLTLLR
jgi:hypothetical protein